MNAIKGRLKVALLVVGILAVGFGLYAAFDIHDAHAHTAAIHGWDISYSWHWVSSVVTNLTTCPACGGSRSGTKTVNTYDVYRQLIHKHYVWGTGWVAQYWTEVYDSTESTVTTVWDDCPNSSCGG